MKEIFYCKPLCYLSIM